MGSLCDRRSGVEEFSSLRGLNSATCQPQRTPEIQPLEMSWISGFDVYRPLSVCIFA